MLQFVTLDYVQGREVMHALRVDGLHPVKYTQGRTVMQALRTAGLRPIRCALGYNQSDEMF